MGGHHDDDAFDLQAERLPDWIDKRAFGSGGFPYEDKLPRRRYREELRALQTELVKFLKWVNDAEERLVVVFEGRDSAGKGGAIQRLTEHLNPRSAHVVALGRPTSIEARQWYFQRYVAQMPPRGQMAIFDRSWYNRAGVERVFGFCSQEETEHFLKEAPKFEAMLARDGVRFVKFFLTIGKEMQMTRLNRRWRDPLLRWKLSEIDEKAIKKWDDYSVAFDHILRRTDSEEAPWTVIRANDKRRARLETIRHLLSVTPYKHKDESAIGTPDRGIALPAEAFLEAGGEEP